MTATLRFDEVRLRGIRTPGSFTEAIANEVEDAADKLREEVNRQIWGEPKLTTLTNVNKVLEETYAPAVRKQLEGFSQFEAAYRTAQSMKEGPTMTDFNAHTVYLTDDQEARARSGEMKRAEALAVLTEGFLPIIELVAGDIVTFDDSRGNSYEIVRVEGASAITRRLVANSAGPAGETAVTTLDSIVTAVREGRATINPEDDA